MCRKLIVIAFVVLTLGFATVNDAVAVLWTGAGADNLWTNPANWEGNAVPSPTDWVNIESPGATAPNGPLVQEGMYIEIDGMANELPGEPTLTITGGTLILSGWGIWWGDAADCVATCNMSGGTMSLIGGPGIHEFGWGGASGKWIMTGGTVNAQGTMLSTGPGNTGELYLHGGAYNVGTARADRSDRFGGGLVLNDGGLIDITEGALVLDVLEGQEGRYMQYLEDLMAAGQITAYGGTGEFEMDFDGRNPGKVTLTAVFTGKASSPDPADGSYYRMPPGVSLSWVPHEVAVSHDVYIGDDSDSVNNGTGNTSMGSQTDPFFLVGFGAMVEPRDPYPDGLVPGTTYYWRVDEVEADGTVHKGDVWSFTVPPRTAINPDPADGAEFVDLNVLMSWVPGLDALFHTVYLGDDFDAVSAATGGTQQSDTTYSPASPLDPEKVYYWRVDESDAAATYTGDVWTFTTPGAVGNPQPANGATGVQMVADLAWTPADNATSHQLYLGTDKDAVRSATSASPEYLGSKVLGSESHDPGKLAWDADYYWRVDAVYADPANPVKGPIWSFTTADFITVDDFESYNDINPGEPGSNRILEAWADGYGTTDNGALVGNEFPPYAEQTIVHSGIQSMPYSYDNNLKYSEATLTLTYPTDWTEEGVGALSLWFRGATTNAAEQMYVAVNGVVVNHDNPNATQVTNWEEWVIPLQTFADLGVDLTNVTSIAIGFGTPGDTTTAGGSGKMYFDDIKLYRPAATPSDSSLLAWWKLDDNADDSSGNGNHGTLVGDPQWAAGMIDGALNFDGVDDYVDCGSSPTLDFGTGDFTISAWVQTSDAAGETIFAKGGDDSGGIRYRLFIEGNPGVKILVDDDVDKYDPEGNIPVVDGQWHHIIGMRAGTALRVYIDGLEDEGVTTHSESTIPATYDLSGTTQHNAYIGAVTSHTDGSIIKFFGGLIDDVRIYNRALSAAEILELTGQ